MIIAVRHGETQSNETKTFRGWSSIPLNEEGVKAVEATARILKEQGGTDAEKIYCCDLPRTVQTAHILGKALNLPIEPTKELRTFNVGDLTGEKVTDARITQLKRHIKQPNRRIPGGNSYAGFKKRVAPILKRCVESDSLFILVTHGMVLSLLAAMCDGTPDRPDIKTIMQGPPVPPAGLMVIGKDWKCYYSTPHEKTGEMS